MKKNLLFVFTLVIFLAAFRVSECIDEKTTTTFGRKCAATVCESYFNGNCMDFHCDYASYSYERSECRNSCDLKECKSWDTNITEKEPETIREVCCKFDTSSPTTPCLGHCAAETRGERIEIRKCPDPVCK